MDTLGHHWKSATLQTTNLHTQMHRDQLQHQVRLEQRATEFFHNLKSDMPAHIEDAIKRNSITVGIPAHSSLLNSAAFLHFKVWLAAAGLSCVCSA